MGGVQVGRGGYKGIDQMSVQSMEEVGKEFCPNLLQPFLANIDTRKPGSHCSTSVALLKQI